MITSEMRKQGITIQLKKNGNLWVTPKDRITPEIRGFIAKHKPQIIHEIKARPAISGRKPGNSKSSLPEHLGSKPLMGDIAKRIIEDKIPSILIDWYQKRMESSDHGGCKCKDMQAKMNDVGPTGIEKNRQFYVDHFKSTIKYLPFAENISEKFIDMVMAEVEAERAKLPDDTIVVTAADQGFIKGVYLLAWTSLHMNDCQFRVYDLGLDKSSRMYKDMVSWGVEFVEFKNDCVLKDYTQWQTLNKPRYLLHAMKGKEVVLWIDADAAVAGCLTEMVSKTRTQPLVPDHGFHPAWNENPPQLYPSMPEPRRLWGPIAGQARNAFPCAGILGLSKVRDQHWVQDWADRIDMAAEKGLLGLYKYYDQGVLQDVYMGPLVDGRIWNNLELPRESSVHQVFGHYASHSSVIHHYGGDIKPWMDWALMKWPNPKYVKERHDCPAE